MCRAAGSGQTLTRQPSAYGRRAQPLWAQDGDPTHGAYAVVTGLYPVLTLRDGRGNEVRITRVTGRAAPYRKARR